MKILLVDDHVIIRDGIKLLLKSDPSLEFAGEAGNGKEAVTLCNELHPDIIVMDIDMPVMNGIDAVKEIRKTNKDVKIIILSMYENESYLRDCIAAEINGYLFKLESMDTLLQAIHSVSSGMEVFSPGVIRIISKHLNRKSAAETLNIKTDILLSEREKEVVVQIAAGKSNKQIADDLLLSIFTVKNHRKNIMHKLGFKKVTELIRYAIKMGYVN
ncbi:MAG: response regulator transcription factor [Ignavibacteriaceae bacterium]|nr:response regulator transcription factor [Ignavibacteriaceae bacterium]